MSFILALPGFAQMRAGQTKENMTSREMSGDSYNAESTMSGPKEMKREIQKEEEEESSQIEERKKTQDKKRKKDRLKKSEEESTEGISTP